MAEKQRYIILTGNIEVDPSTFKVLCGNIEQLRLEEFDPKYDFDKNKRGYFITDLTGDLEYNNIGDLIYSFYVPLDNPPLLQYGLISKEDLVDDIEIMQNKFPLFGVMIPFRR